MEGGVKRLCLASILASLTLFGCDDTTARDGGLDDSMVAASSVELGTGTSAFETIPETGGELELVGGPQGGFHVFVAARLRGLNPEGMTLTFSATDVDTGANVGVPATFNLITSRVQPDGEGHVRVGDFLILDEANPDNVRGRTLDITVLAEEAGTGRSATDHRVVLIVDNVGG